MIINGDGKLNAELDRAITSFYERLSNWEESVAALVKLTPRQCHALSQIGECAPVRMKPISQRLGVTTGTMTIMAERLEKLGLIERSEDSNDRRASLLSLSAKGNAVYRRHLSHHRELNREFLSVLDRAQAETLIALLGKLSEVL